MLNRLVLTTGGTGGHIFPALALAETVRELHPECEMVFIGGDYGPERELARRNDLPFVSLPARGVMGRGLKSLGAVLLMASSLFKALIFLRRFKPDAVLGFGGYAGFAPGLAASLLRIPTAIHEQNSLPGMTNRVLGKRADRIFLSFPDEFNLFDKKKVRVYGNPVRSKILKSAMDTEVSGSKKRLLVLGGSQGAKGINQAITGCLPELREQGISIWHQTGDTDYEKIKEKYEHLYPEAHVESFIDDMARAYSFADLVFCRAGATTLAELCIAGRPSVLVPFPYATRNHQLNNARFLEKAGAAMVLKQSYLEEVNVATLIGDLFGASRKLNDMGAAAKSLACPDAGKNILKEMQGII